ncbi:MULTISPECIES: hypothetical protein [unclassified Micromonospora]|uniref:hypothetical protein n=1 Tax=unclassified Micromonospora TaxID=2617518 RepID=UPI002FF290F9
MADEYDRAGLRGEQLLQVVGVGGQAAQGVRRGDDPRSTTEAALSSVDLQKIMAPVDATNVWAVFKAYLDAVAAQAADELVPRWNQRLGGADLFTLPNAWAMAEALRLDYGSMGPFGIAP